MSTPDPDPRPNRAAVAARRITLRAFDVSERTARWSLAEQRTRVSRWRGRAFMIAQSALAAALAWFIANDVMHRYLPVFAPVSAMLALGMSFGQRTSRVLEVCLGVAIGVLMGDAFIVVFGTGWWQVALVIFAAMSVATWVGARPLMINQAGIQAATVMTLLPDPTRAGSRFVDALLGCAIALAFAMVAPTSPVQRPRIRAAQVLTEVAQTLHAARDALAAGDQEAAERTLIQARGSERALSALSAAAAEGVAVVRYSPFQRGERDHVQQVADLVAPLDRLTRNLRVLARRAVVLVWREEQISDEHLRLMGEVALVTDFCAAELRARRLPERARERIVAVARETSHLELGSLSSSVVVAQLRSICVDLLELTGLDYPDARELVPEMD
ncbi:FUSC family protein [Aestuariimicrobium kwangyangense]|uniref:FUSC family protein n=1 Tax=Aestuariimicrobium kwangyangense TaxID=396389 RepID=UPI0003B49E71|nr:FUSC family protein [Aestuariimicrobium kwangyangense]